MLHNRLSSRLTSVSIAKSRLQKVLFSDRMHCSTDSIEQMKDDIYHTISKYMEIDQAHFEITLTRKEMYIKYTGEK